MSIREREVVIDSQKYVIGQAVQRNRDHFTSPASKRGLDLFCATAGLIALTPLFILIAILIKLEDPRAPVFFSQVRVGKDGKLFRMYKFRSMLIRAEEMLQPLIHKNEVQGAMFKIKNDPRITKVGRWKRKLSIDELPQLWNVFKGDMSMVGPRPPLPREVQQYTAYDLQRLVVTPGCTGLWQVSGRNNVGFKDMVEMDLKYISERSFMSDVIILLKTVRLFFGSKDAF
jgi:lipopolysaccharide/colanic/teichoic acid biosynthesis glycosyltransferase